MTPREEVKYWWRKTCKHDAINPTACFVEFSEDNPYQEDYNEVMERVECFT